MMINEMTPAAEVPLKKNVSYVCVATERVGSTTVRLSYESVGWELAGDALITVEDDGGRLHYLALSDVDQAEWAFAETVRRLATPEIQRLVARADDLTVEETVELARLALATGDLDPDRLKAILENRASDRRG